MSSPIGAPPCEIDTLIDGGVSERPKERASKARDGSPIRGFKSHRHRHGLFTKVTGPSSRKSGTSSRVRGGVLLLGAAARVWVSSAGPGPTVEERWGVGRAVVAAEAAAGKGVVHYLVGAAARSPPPALAKNAPRIGQ